MNNGKKEKQIENIYDKRKFLFTYNDIINKNLNLNHNIQQFWQNWFRVTKFNIYSINFKSKTSLKNIFTYNFCL